MAKKFPKTLYVKLDGDSDADWFVADEDALGLVDMNCKVKIATYQLVEISIAEGVAKFTKSRS